MCIGTVLVLKCALDMDNPLAYRQRDLALAMVAQCLLNPCSKQAATRLCAATTLTGEMGVEDADGDELPVALDRRPPCQSRIENKLAKRYREDGEKETRLKQLTEPTPFQARVLVLLESEP